MDTTAPGLPETLQALPPRLQAELLRHLRCTDEVRSEERERYRPDPVMAAWVDLLDELESGGPLMREVGQPDHASRQDRLEPRDLRTRGVGRGPAYRCCGHRQEVTR